MKIAIQSMENLRIQEKAKKDDSSVAENIEDELSMLQNAILEAERQMKLFREENMLLRQNETISEKLSERLELENQSLLTRLKISEEGFFFLKNRLDSIQSEVAYTTFHDKDLKMKDGKNDGDKILENGHCTTREQEVIKTLVEDNNKFVVKIQEKDKTIQKLKENLDVLSAEVERQIANESVKADVDAKERAKHQHQFTAELSNIKDTLDSSHRELTHKIVDLHAELETLNEENRSLREQIFTKDKKMACNTELFQEIETLKSENTVLNEDNNRLKSALNKHYPGIDFSFFTKEMDDLREENKFLRFSINSERLELVDSNLRKKKRIKDMHKEIEDLKSQLSSHSLQVAAPPSFSISSPTLDDKADNNSQDDSKKQTSTKSSSSIEELEMELSVRDGIISRLKDENESLQSKTNLYKVQLDKNKVEHELRKQNMEANSVLEGELRALRNMVKELGNHSAFSGNKIQNDDNEFELDEGISDGPGKRTNNCINTSTGNDCFSTLDTLDSINTQENSKHFNGEDTNLQKELQCAYDDIEKYKKQEKIYASQTNINKEKIRELKGKVNNLKKENIDLVSKLDTAKSDMSDLQLAFDNLEEKSSKNEASYSSNASNKDKLRERKEKIRALNDENINLIQKLDCSKNETIQAQKQILKLRADLSLANSLKDNAVEEANKLIVNIGNKEEEEKEDEEELTEIVEVLNESLNEMHFESQMLVDQLNRTESEKKMLEKEISIAKERIEEKLRNDFEGKISELENNLSLANGKFNRARKENEELNDQNNVLKENVENIRNDINEKHFKEWLEKDLDRRLAFLSPDLRVSEIEELEPQEKQTRRDHARIIRKLQVENQTLRTQMLNLEDEAVETTKIIADMERGHGHLTGTLRVHLILQKVTSEKVLESSLQQYSTDYEILENKFKMMEKKYDKEKKYSKRRDAAWELFTNASGTITNIQTILTDGLAKVENDLDDALSSDEFDNKDYRSRLWILKRQLSDVENRHRELQLKAEELNLRLNAKTTEFEVTQDELEDTTRDLESRESSIEKLTKEMARLLKENKKLTDILQKLKVNQDQSVGVALMENESLHKALADMSEEQDEIMKSAESDFNKVLHQLEEKDGALQQIKRMKDDSDKEIDALKRRINFLDKKLTQVGNEREKLKKEAEVRGRCTMTAVDDHGTIHMLRSNLKTLAKENAELKESVLSKQKVMYDMSKDLHQLRMETAIGANKNEKRASSKDEVERKMIQDVADLKSQNFLLETKLKDADRRLARSPEKDDIIIQDVFQKKLKDKETEVETLKREISGLKRLKMTTVKSKSTSDHAYPVETINEDMDPNIILEGEVKYLTEQIEMLQNLVKQHNLEDEYELLTSLKEDYEIILDQQKAELESLNVDIDKKRKRIKELLKFIEESRNEKNVATFAEKSSKIIEDAKDDEINSLLNSLEQRSSELEVWRAKAEHYKIELQRLKFTANRTVNDGYHNNREHADEDDETFLKISEYEDQTISRGDICVSPRSQSDGNTYTLGSPKGQRPGELNIASINALYLADQIKGSNIINASEGTEIENHLKIVEEEETIDNLKPNIILNKKSRIPIRPSVKKKYTIEHSTERVFSVNVAESSIAEEPNESHDDNDQVNEFQIIIKMLHDELNLYRTNIGMTDTDNLEKLGYERLNNLINYHIDKRHIQETEKLHSEIKQLLIEHVHLKEELNAIKSYEYRSNSDCSSDEDGVIKESEMFAMTEKCYLKIDENKTLKELLETQTQNVKSQSCVIQTLKNDIADGHEKLNEDFRHVCFSLKRKKKEVRGLKKQLKQHENNSMEEQKQRKKETIILKQKLAKEIRKKKTLGKDKDSIAKKFNKAIDFISKKVDKKDSDVEKLETELKLSLESTSTSESVEMKEDYVSKKYECNEALKEAEEALFVAKEKMVASNAEISELKRDIQLLSRKERESMHTFETTNNDMRNALNEKNALLSNVQSEFLHYKKVTTKEIEELQAKIVGIESECRDKMNAALMSSISELESKKYDESARDGGLLSKHSLDEINRNDLEEEIHQSYLISAQDDPTTTSMHEISLSQDGLKTDSSFQTDPIGENEDIQKKYEMEIEIEILQGCNEELENEANSLKLLVNDLEMQLDEKTINLKQTTDDLGNSLQYIEQQDKKIETLISDKNAALGTLKMENEKYKAILKDINSKEAEIDDLNTTIKHTTTTEDRMDTSEYKIKLDEYEKENESLKFSTEEMQIEITSLTLKIKDYEDEIKEKANDLDQTTSDLEKALIYIQERELEFGTLLSDKGSMSSDNEKSIETDNDKVSKTVGNTNTSSDVEKLKFDLESKSLVIQTLKNELTDKIDQYDKLITLLSIRRDESRELILLQEKLQHELEKKEYFIHQIKSQISTKDIEIPDISLDESLENESQDFMLLQLDDIELWTDAEKEKLIHDQRQSIFNIATILSSTRERNRDLEEQLEELKAKYQRIKNDKKIGEDDVNNLTLDLSDLKEKLQEIRMLIHVSPDKDFPNEGKAIAFRTKLYCAYKELREKSIEIGTLQMCINIKDSKITQLESEIELTGNYSYSPKDVENTLEKANGENTDLKKTSTFIKTETTFPKSEYDGFTEKHSNGISSCICYQNELVNVIDKLKELERNLILQDQALRENYVINADRLNNSDLSVSEETFSTYLLETSVKRMKRLESDTTSSNTVSPFRTNKDTQTEDNRGKLNDIIMSYTTEDVELRDEVNKISTERDQLQSRLVLNQSELSKKEETIKDLENQIEYETKQRNDGR